MYVPPYAKSENKRQIAQLVKSYPFVTLVSKDSESNPFISHVPVVVAFENDEIKSIKGHLALKNPHVKLLKQNNEVTIIFNGPHTYVSPTWYKSGRDVPTWNYCVVHVKGKLELDHSFQSICKNLVELTKEFEGSHPQAWKFELPNDLKDPDQLTSAIVAFGVTPELVTGKFKLAQSRPKEDQLGVIDGLSQRNDDMSAEVAKLMKRNQSS